jgi:hypothetical protein
MQFIATAVVAAMLSTHAHALSLDTATTAELMALRLTLADQHRDARAGFHLRLPEPRDLRGHPGKVDLSLRPLPHVEVGFRELGKSQGGAITLVSDSGVKLGLGIYMAKIGIGLPMDRQLMLVLQVPLR